MLLHGKSFFVSMAFGFLVVCNTMRLSIATKVFLGFTLVLAGFIAVSLHAVARFQAMGELLHLVNDGYLPLTRSVARLVKIHEGRQGDVVKITETKDPRVKAALARIAKLHVPRITGKSLEKSRRVLQSHFGGLEAKGEGRALRSLLKRLDRIISLQKDYDDKASEFFDAVESGDDETWSSLLPGLKQTGRHLDRELQLLDLNISGRVAAAASKAERYGSDSVWAIIILTLISTLVAALVMFMTASALRPLAKLTQSVKKLAKGEQAAKVTITRKDEVGLLAQEFDRLLDALSERNQRLQEQRVDLLRAERLAAVGRIAAQVAHEIRNPLSSIALNVELLAEDTQAASPATKKLVEAVAREVDRLTEVTEEYLRFARMPDPELKPMSLKVLLLDLAGFLEPNLKERSIELDLDLPDGLAAIMADEDQLRRAFLNLMRNSIDAMPEGGNLEIAARNQDEWVEVRLTDTGQGIPEEVLDRIFDPFFSTKERGTGLGLALTQQIIVEHKGRIDVESHLGSGTTFVVKLPAAEDR